MAFEPEEIKINDNHSWVKTHRELVKKLSDYKNRQEELISILESSGVEKDTLIDENIAEKRVNLSEIDPYDFFCFVYKYGVARRLKILQKIAEYFKVSKPEDTNGVPTTNAQKVMLFPFRSDGRSDEVEQLWGLFEMQLNNSITNEKFEQILAIKGVGATKLTEALFNIDPENNLPINAQTRPYLKEKFDINTKFRTYDEYLEILDQVRNYTDAPFFQISHEAWLWNTNRKDTNYWVAACIWEMEKNQIDKTREFLDEGYWKTGYDLFNNDQGKRIAKLLNKVAVGDRIAIRYHTRNTGVVEITGVGTVTDTDGISEGKLYVEWDENVDLYQGPKPEGRGSGNWWETLIHLKRKKDIKLIFGDSTEGNQNNKKQVDNKQVLTMNNTLNQILYGPPGTGKTYHTINKAIQIVDPEFYEENKFDRKALNIRFKELLYEDRKENLKDWRIAFTTFHQSFSYEDFVEGIKPVLADEEEEVSENINYKRTDGIFKLLCNKARYTKTEKKGISSQMVSLTENEFKEAQFYKVSLGNSNNEEDNAIYEYCIQNNKIAIGHLDGFDLTDKSESEIKEIGRDNPDLSTGAVQMMNYFVNYLKIGNYVVVSNGNKHVRAIGKVKGEYEYHLDSGIRYPHFRSVEWILKDKNIPVEEVYGKDFQMQPIYSLKKEWINAEFFKSKENSVTGELSQTSTDNFVLIIDEINRGNISQIFGELITLIEHDKREGEEEELTAILPYSKKKFAVPSNVYLIGTMNTADRSIEALDTALRRRFVFEEMPPVPKVINREGTLKGSDGNLKIGSSIFSLSEILETINIRVNKLLDKDHLIGHSYFMKVSTSHDLQSVFMRNIIPLLEEYFYGDLGKIQLVLGRGFIKQAKSSGDTQVFADSDYEDSIFGDREIWEIKHEWMDSEQNFEQALTTLVANKV